MKANKFFEVFRKSKPFGHIPNTFDGDCLMTCGNAFEFAEAYVKQVIVTAKNPYNKKTQYTEWAAAEFMLDTLIRNDRIMKEPKDKRTKAWKQWKKDFDAANSIGLGDVVEKVTKATGIKKIFDASGKDCGCDKRKEKLNKLRFRFTPVRCFTESQYHRWTYFRTQKGNLTEIHIKLIHECFEQLFVRTFKRKSCCYEEFIREIDRVYETYQ